MKQYFVNHFLTNPVITKKEPIYTPRKAINLSIPAWEATRKLAKQTNRSMTEIVEFLVLHAKVVGGK